jgi:hypothetical protein
LPRSFLSRPFLPFLPFDPLRSGRGVLVSIGFLRAGEGCAGGNLERARILSALLEDAHG